MSPGREARAGIVRIGSRIANVGQQLSEEILRHRRAEVEADHPVHSGRVVLCHAIDRQPADQDEAATAVEDLAPALHGRRQETKIDVARGEAFQRLAATARGGGDFLRCRYLLGRERVDPFIASTELCTRPG